jgi:hypothetical protein
MLRKILAESNNISVVVKKYGIHRISNDCGRIRINCAIRSNGCQSRTMSVVAGKASGRNFGRTVIYAGAAVTTGIVGYLTYGGAVARHDAREVKREWEKLRDVMEVEVGEGSKLSMLRALPRACFLGVLFIPLVSISVPTLVLTLLEDRSPAMHSMLGWAAEWMRDLWCTVLRMTLERSGAGNRYCTDLCHETKIHVYLLVWLPVCTP